MAISQEKYPTNTKVVSDELLLRIIDDPKTPIEFHRSFISGHLDQRGPDPLTEDWRPLPEFPNYRINRCGDVMNEKGFILARQYSFATGGTFDRVCLYRGNVQYSRGTDGILKEVFKEDYI